MFQQIGTKGTMFADDLGRARVFSGVNYVFKGEAPDEDGIVHYHHPLTAENLRHLKQRGVNILRLGMTWAGIEPEMDKYNDVYLDEVRQVIDDAAKEGIYVYLDWHQDLYSGFGLGVGDGAPAWACVTKKKMHKPRFIWAEGYFFGGAVFDCFDAFWENRDLMGRGVQDRFCDMLAYTVKRLGDAENVMGYDVFNEPYPGSEGGKIFRTIVKSGVKAALKLPAKEKILRLKQLKNKQVMDALSVADDPDFYRSVVGPAEKRLIKFDIGVYYDFLCRAGEAIRSVTDKGVLFFENSYYSNTGIPCRVPRPVYAGGRSEKNLAFAPHGYDLTVDTPLTNTASTHRVDFIFDEHRRKQLRMGLPVLVGEWGGMVAGGDEYPALEHLIAKFDSNGWSHTYWHYSREIADSKIFDILNRPYPRAVAGKNLSYGFDRETNTFTLTYEGDPAAEGPTEVYLPAKPEKVSAPEGFAVTENDGTFLLTVPAKPGKIEIKVVL